MSNFIVKTSGAEADDALEKRKRRPGGQRRRVLLAFTQLNLHVLRGHARTDAALWLFQ
jgi:hypothetical protein